MDARGGQWTDIIAATYLMADQADVGLVKGYVAKSRTYMHNSAQSQVGSTRVQGHLDTKESPLMPGRILLTTLSHISH